MLHSCRMVYVSLNTAWDSLAASSYDCAHVCRHVHTHVCTPAYTRLHACLHTCLHHVTKSLIRGSQAVGVEPRGDLGCAPFWRRSVAYHRRRSVAAACRLNDGGHGHRRWSVVDGYGGWDVGLAGSKRLPLATVSRQTSLIHVHAHANVCTHVYYVSTHALGRPRFLVVHRQRHGRV